MLHAIVITGAALALAGPAMAQVANPAAQAPGAAAQQMPDESGGATSANATSQVAAVVESEFPVYDADKSGELDQNEFSKWVTALKQQEMQSTGQAMAPDQLTSWASAAFRKADADRSTAVSKNEFTRYLGG